VKYRAPENGGQTWQTIQPVGSGRLWDVECAAADTSFLPVTAV
jgi:hypothetical protein